MHGSVLEVSGGGDDRGLYREKSLLLNAKKLLRNYDHSIFYYMEILYRDYESNQLV